MGPCRVGGLWAFPTDLCIRGEIVLGDAEVFASVTGGYPSGSLVRLEGPGGNVIAALDIGDIIHKRHFNTIVSRRSPCASACAVLFLSGNHAIIAWNAYLIYHMASDGNGNMAPDDLNRYIATRVVAWGGVTYDQIWFLLHSAPPSGGMVSTEWLATQLGFRYSYVPNYFNLWRNCQTKFCVAH
jgi:hypothetical protein